MKDELWNKLLKENKLIEGVTDKSLEKSISKLDGIISELGVVGRSLDSVAKKEIKDAIRAVQNAKSKVNKELYLSK